MVSGSINEFVGFITGGAESFTPEVVVRLLLVFMLIQAITSICKILGAMRYV